MEKKKILVVDDEADFLQMIRARLEVNNYEVITVSSGKAALAKLQAEKPDAILLDIIMPDLDGLKVLEEIRKKDKDLPVFMVSAYANEERFDLANKLNASGFILKTGDLQKEITNINNVLRLANRYKQR